VAFSVGQVYRLISTGKLKALLLFHLRPIKQVVFLLPYLPASREREA
jgi:hypothetical protein